MKDWKELAGQVGDMALTALEEQFEGRNILPLTQEQRHAMRIATAVAATWAMRELVGSHPDLIDSIRADNEAMHAEGKPLFKPRPRQRG